MTCREKEEENDHLKDGGIPGSTSQQNSSIHRKSKQSDSAIDVILIFPLLYSLGQMLILSCDTMERLQKLNNV